MRKQHVLCTGTNKVIPKKDMKLAENPHDIVEKFRCENIDGQKDCMMRDCLDCSVNNLYLSNLREQW